MKCPLCWFEFPDEEALAAHVAMEESVDWPVDGVQVPAIVTST